MRDLCTLGGGVVDFSDQGTFEQIVEGAKGVKKQMCLEENEGEKINKIGSQRYFGARLYQSM